jgi:ribonuclease HI
VKAFGVEDLAQFAARIAELRATLSPPSAAGDFVAYTDGACFGNPEGPGGWAAATFQGTDQWLLFGHLSSTSNNRAEALGVLGALEWVPPGSSLRLHSDSELTVRQLEGKYKIKANLDIWQLIQQTRVDKQIVLAPEWGRGHAGDPHNELADELSKLGARNLTIADLGAMPEPPAEPPELVGLQPRGDWEREFLSSIRDQLRKGRALSPKQLAVIDRIRARV